MFEAIAQKGPQEVPSDTFSFILYGFGMYLGAIWEVCLMYFGYGTRSIFGYILEGTLEIFGSCFGSVLEISRRRGVRYVENI